MSEAETDGFLAQGGRVILLCPGEGRPVEIKSCRLSSPDLPNPFAGEDRCAAKVFAQAQRSPATGLTKDTAQELDFIFRVLDRVLVEPVFVGFFCLRRHGKEYIGDRQGFLSSLQIAGS